MQCKPSLNGVRLIPESALESDAIERWRGKVATLEVKEYSVPAHAALEFRDPPATEPRPEPWTPKVGDRVLCIATGEPAEVVAVFRHKHIGVKLDRGGWIGGHIREFEPIITAKAEPWTPKVGDRVRVKQSGKEAIVFKFHSPEVVRIAYDDGSTGAPDLGSIEPVPAPTRRTIRVPAIGQWVKTPDGDGVVRMVTYIWRPGVQVGFSDKADQALPADEVTPIGPNPRWIEITLPEEMGP